MLVQNFSDNPSQFEDFEVWEIENMQSFFDCNGVIKEIFENEYKMKVSEFDKKRNELPETNMGIITGILDQVGDKHFFVFTAYDKNHSELIAMQTSGQMNFGINIEDISNEKVYFLVMDKRKETRMGV